MTFHQKIDPDSVFDPSADLERLRRFLGKHGIALANAAHALGGGAASARVFVLIEAIRATRRLTRTQRRQLVDLYKLLTLEHVGGLDRTETVFFAEISLESPLVDEICLLAEKLEALLVWITSDDPAEDGQIKPADVFSQVA